MSPDNCGSNWATLALQEGIILTSKLEIANPPPNYKFLVKDDVLSFISRLSGSSTNLQILNFARFQTRGDRSYYCIGSSRGTGGGVKDAPSPLIFGNYYKAMIFRQFSSLNVYFSFKDFADFSFLIGKF